MERLFSQFCPDHYQLEYRINKETEKIYAKAVIFGEKTEKSKNTLKLHAKNLKIVSIKQKNSIKTFNQSEDILEINDIDSRKIELEIIYTFNINHNMEGAYLSTYQHQNKTEKIISTQFESHYARQAFPCIDEPEAKATFELKIIDTDIEDTILSNMPVKTERILEYTSVDLDENPKNGVSLNKVVKRKIVEFEKTPRMSTYLVAFIVGRFHKISTKNQHGIIISTYAPLNQNKSTLHFPNKIASEALDFYDELFKTPYPLPKLDQVAIPDFEAGAMENWGLVTYRESCLLADEHSAKSTKDHISTVITHELSHQWFGNLVTMRWWDDLWLNESFANIMQYYSVDKLYPDWHIWQVFFTNDCVAALNRDALPNVQSVRQEINDPEEIASLFDGAIVYAKGARLILMLMRLMGEENFFAGIRDYFTQHQYQNTTSDDLWRSLHPYANFDVKNFMEQWLSQPGYPMITDMVQQRFLLNGGTDDSKWEIPEVKDDMSGHYLINLSSEEFSQKIEQFPKLSLEQKLRLLIDRQLLSRTPIVSSGSLFDLLPYFKTETSEPLFSIVAGIAIGFKIFITPETENYKKFQQYIYHLVEPNLQKLGFKVKKEEKEEETKLRDIVLSLALFSEKQEVISKLAQQYKPDLQKIHPEVRTAVIGAKFKETKEEIFDQLLQKYQEISNPDIKDELLAVITSAKKPKNTKKLLELLKKPDIIKPQDHIYLVSYLLSNYKTKQETMEWIYHNWQYLQDLVSDKSLDYYVKILASKVYTRDESDQFFEFFDQKINEPSIARAITVARGEIASRLRLIKDDTKEIQKRLENL